jgi:hypothetical protein
MLLPLPDFIDQLLVHFGSTSNPVAQKLVKAEEKMEALERLVQELQDNRESLAEARKKI